MVQDCPWFRELPAYIRLVGGASLAGKFWSCKDIPRRDNETLCAQLQLQMLSFKVRLV